MQNIIVLTTLTAMLIVETFLVARWLAPLRSRASFRRRRRRIALLAQ
jgi:hypothetical protein